MECEICVSVYDSQEHLPKILSCGHTLCLCCVKKLLGMHPAGNLTCPKCRIMAVYNKAEEITTNFDMIPKEPETLDENKSEELRCSSHHEDRAEMACKECRLYLCLRCIKEALKSSRRHVNHSMEDDCHSSYL